MKIYTKTGDAGKTSLLSGERVSKFHDRIEAYGTVDELNSFVGLLMSEIEFNDISTNLISIQNNLLNIGSLLAVESEISFSIPGITNSDLKVLENKMDEMNETLPEIKNFILPGGNKIVALCHVCRTICRRAERMAFKVNADEKALIYLNRLSDYFFVLSRYLSMKTNAIEIPWNIKN